MIRFVYIFNYGKEVSRQSGEEWYLNEHVPRLKSLPGIQRCISWRAIDPPPIPFPSAGAPTPFNQFVRRSELWFDDLDTASAAVRDNYSLWEPARPGEPGFGQVECLFLDEEPQYNLLKDVPAQHYRYITLPLNWPQGAPEVDEDAEIFINTYCISYGKIGFARAEDWYIGHHTREGKQLPGMKHYRTWKALKVPEITGSGLGANKWVRLTELGMSREAYMATMVNEETRIRFTPPAGAPMHQVLAGWLNMGIKLREVEELLK